MGVFQLGVIVFTAGSLLCGLSGSLEVLILARIVQGVGCAVDRFQRVEKLNSLIAAGWAIKEMKSENNSTFFVLEKAD